MIALLSINYQVILASRVGLNSMINSKNVRKQQNCIDRVQAQGCNYRASLEGDQGDHSNLLESPKRKSQKLSIPIPLGEKPVILIPLSEFSNFVSELVCVKWELNAVSILLRCVSTSAHGLIKFRSIVLQHICKIFLKGRSVEKY